jgi:general secretion pathway protein B
VSLILEALNRSQKDRQSDSASGVPGLDTPAYIDELDGDRKWQSYLPWFGLIVAIVVIGLLLFDRFGDDAKAPVELKPVEMDSEAAATIARTEFAKVESSPVEGASGEELTGGPAHGPEKPVATTQPVPQAIDQSMKHDPAVAALYGSRQQSVTADPLPDIAAEQRTLAAAPQPEAASRPQEEAIDIEEVLARTEAQLNTARLQEHPAPFLSDLSQQKKDAIPSILYRQHDYSSSAAQSSVVLNGKSLKVGGTVASGIKLEEILHDSIVLSHRGEQFRLRALNSWVNL